MVKKPDDFEELRKVVKAVALQEKTTTPNGLAQYRRLERKLDNVSQQEMFAANTLWERFKKSDTWKRIQQTLDTEVI